MKILAALLCGFVALAACTGGDSVDTAPDPELADALTSVSESGRTTPLSDLTDFDWDTVHVFGEAASAEDIEQAVGTSVIDGEFFTAEGDLLVFTLDDAVVRSSVIQFGPVTTDGTTSFSADALLVPRPDSRLIDLVES